MDVIGEDSYLADAECIFAVVDFLREVGLTADEVKVSHCYQGDTFSIEKLR